MYAAIILFIDKTHAEVKKKRIKNLRDINLIISNKRYLNLTLAFYLYGIGPYKFKGLVVPK
ncbi:MAG: hypothetical protein ACMUEK_00610 [Sodalis sp. (in: enterobacteria)]